MFRYASFFSILLLAILFLSKQAGDSFAQEKLTKDDIAHLRSGLDLQFIGDVKSAEPLDSRISRLLALYVPKGTPPSPWLPPGAFSARFTGYFKLSKRGTYKFKMENTGNAVLVINDKTVLPADHAGEAVEADLIKGYNKLNVTYASPSERDAKLRVFWSGEDFTFEPLPPDALFCRGDDAGLIHHQQLRDGRELYATMGCARCHALPGNLTVSDLVMPEMGQRAPSLIGAGKRFQQSWLLRWITDPRSMRPEATMPRVLHGVDAQGKAEDIAAYLTTLEAPAPEATAKGTDEQIERGSKLFENLGCIACHRLTDPKEKDDWGRLSLFYVGAKFQSGALDAFLQHPHKNYPWTRMPDFRLDANESQALTAYLIFKTSEPFRSLEKTGDAKSGAKLFREVGCANCHATDAKGTTEAAFLPTPAKANLTKGCLADDDMARGKSPEFAFDKENLASLREFLATDGNSLRQEVPTEFSMRQMKALQCTSCHRRDGVPTRWQEVLEDEGKFQELLPLLTWAGEKLKPDWTVTLLNGQIAHSSRPWLKARMPQFPSRANMLSVGLSHEHGYGVSEDPRPAPQPDLVEIGKSLLPQMGGFNCVNCHAVNKTAPVAIFEARAQGIDLLDAAIRLRYDYYRRWMIDPTRVDNTTPMIKLSPDGRTTPLGEVLDGDAHKQFDAIWQYIQTLPKK